MIILIIGIVIGVVVDRYVVPKVIEIYKEKMKE